MGSLEDTVGDSLNKFMSHLSRMANNLEHSGLSVQEQEEFLEKSKETVGECCVMDMEHRSNVTLLRRTEAVFGRGDNKQTLNEIYDELKSQEHAVEHDFEGHDIYINMVDVVNEAKQKMGLEDAAEPDGDGEDGLLVADVQFSTICPISKMEMTDPCKSRKCHHTFDRSSILSLLQNRKAIRCPIGGCGHQVTNEDLVSDHRMQRIIDRRDQ